MNTKTQEVQTAVALASAAALTTEVIMRMPRSKISKAINGNFLTRTSASVMAMNVITEELKRVREPVAAPILTIS